MNLDIAGPGGESSTPTHITVDMVLPRGTSNHFKENCLGKLETCNCFQSIKKKKKKFFILSILRTNIFKKNKF